MLLHEAVCGDIEYPADYRPDTTHNEIAQEKSKEEIQENLIQLQTAESEGE
jgi:5'-deoxynucleotidase YfbR-like HD superfamily hydrolase